MSQLDGDVRALEEGAYPTSMELRVEARPRGQDQWYPIAYCAEDSAAMVIAQALVRDVLDTRVVTVPSGRATARYERDPQTDEMLRIDGAGLHQHLYGRYEFVREPNGLVGNKPPPHRPGAGDARWQPGVPSRLKTIRIEYVAGLCKREVADVDAPASTSRFYAVLADRLGGAVPRDRDRRRAGSGIGQGGGPGGGRRRVDAQRGSPLVQGRTGLYAR